MEAKAKNLEEERNALKEDFILKMGDYTQKISQLEGELSMRQEPRNPLLPSEESKLRLDESSRSQITSPPPKRTAGPVHKASEKRLQ